VDTILTLNEVTLPRSSDCAFDLLEINSAKYVAM